MNSLNVESITANSINLFCRCLMFRNPVKYLSFGKHCTIIINIKLILNFVLNYNLYQRNIINNYVVIIEFFEFPWNFKVSTSDKYRFLKILLHGALEVFPLTAFNINKLWTEDIVVCCYSKKSLVFKDLITCTHVYRVLILSLDKIIG